MKGIPKFTIFLTANNTASLRTRRRISDYGKEGWLLLEERETVDCIEGKQAGLLVASVWVPHGFFQPWKGWLPRAEVTISENNQIKT